MNEPTRPRCPNCNAPNAAGQAYCGSCGFDLGEPDDESQPTYLQGFADRLTPRPGSIHRYLKWALALWAIAFPVISCSPILLGSSSSTGAAVGGLASLILGAVLFGPWLVGIIILGVLVLITN